MSIVGEVMNAMIAFDGNDIKRINHFLKVYGYAKAIGEAEILDESTQTILEILALTHDIGIRNSEKKYSSSEAKYQHIEGPPEAEKLLKELGVQQTIIDRVCWVIGRHHDYNNIEGLDYQILVEADFLVNAYEKKLSSESIQQFGENVFLTRSGKNLLKKYI